MLIDDDADVPHSTVLSYARWPQRASPIERHQYTESSDKSTSFVALGRASTERTEALKVYAGRSLTDGYELTIGGPGVLFLTATGHLKWMSVLLAHKDENLPTSPSPDVVFS